MPGAISAHKGYNSSLNLSETYDGPRKRVRSE